MRVDTVKAVFSRRSDRNCGSWDPRPGIGRRRPSTMSSPHTRSPRFNSQWSAFCA